MGHDSAKMIKQKISLIWNAPGLGLKLLILFSNGLFRRFFVIIGLFFFVGGYVYSVYGQLSSKYHVSGVVILVQQVTYFLLTLSNLSAVQGLLRYKQHEQLIFQLIEYQSSDSSKKTLFRTISIIFNAIAFSLCGLNLFSFISLIGWTGYRYLFCRDLQFAFFNMMLLSLSELAYALRMMFADLNKELKLIMLNNALHVTTNINNLDLMHFSNAPLMISHQHPKIKTICLYKTVDYSENLVMCVTKKHNKLCDMMDDLNSFLGPVTFLIVVNVVGNIVWFLTVLFEMDIREVVLGRSQITLMTLVCHATSNLTSLLIMIGQIILLATASDKLSKEGDNTGKLCYEFLHQQNFNSEQMKLKHQLSILIKQAECRRPALSGGGFFIVNTSLLGLVTSNVFAYSVVAIQFILNEH